MICLGAFLIAIALAEGWPAFWLFAGLWLFGESIARGRG